MFKDIETITDRKLFQSILKKFFFNKTSYIYSQKGNIEIKLIDTSDGLVKFKVPIIFDEPKNCIIFSRDGANVIFSFLKFCNKSDDIYVYNPAKFQVASVERKDERRALAAIPDVKSVIYVTNFISDKIINDALSIRGNLLKRIKEIVQYDHLNDYEYMKIYFCTEGINDARMKYFYKTRSPIYIQSLNKQHKQDTELNYYKDFIYNSDYYLKKHPEYNSEISVPILHNSKIPYGYIQVNKSTPFTKANIAAIQRMSLIIDELSRKVKLFSASSDRLLVSDVSQNGVGIVFNNQKYIPYYRKDSYVSLDMLLPRAKKASILADVRHLEMMQNNVFKVGFEIKDMDNKSKDNYDNFLGSIYTNKQ